MRSDVSVSLIGAAAALAAGLVTVVPAAADVQLYRITAEQRPLEGYQIQTGPQTGNYMTCEGDLIQKRLVSGHPQPISGECPSEQMVEVLVPRSPSEASPPPPLVLVINGEAPIAFDDLELEVTSGEPDMIAAMPDGRITDGFARVIRVMSATASANAPNRWLLIQTPQHNLKLETGSYTLDGVESPQTHANYLVAKSLGLSVRLIPVLRLLGARVWTSTDHLYILY